MRLGRRAKLRYTAGMKYFFGFILVAIGFFMIWKTDWMMKSFGRVEWAERKLGSGGTWTFYKVLGLGLIFLAFLLTTGGIIWFLDLLFGR